MTKLRDLSTVRRRRVVETEEEEIEDNDEHIVVEEPRPVARSRRAAEPYKPGLGLYIIIGVFTIFLGFMFARSLTGDGGGRLPKCQDLPSWNANAPCR